MLALIKAQSEDGTEREAHQDRTGAMTIYQEMKKLNCLQEISKSS